LCPPCLRARLFPLLVAATAALTFTACTSKQALEDPPIVTSATHQHTLYNGKAQPIEAALSKEGAPAPIITYFHSEEDLRADRNGSEEPPAEVGEYSVRVRRPAGNGYRAGNDITVEYHIQKALVTITAEERQEFAYDGKPKTIAFSVDRDVEPAVEYYHAPSHDRPKTYGFPLDEPPTERGVYHAVIAWAGDAHHMGASKEALLVIR